MLFGDCSPFPSADHSFCFLLCLGIWSDDKGGQLFLATAHPKKKKKKKLFQLIQSADVSQDPVLLDAAFSPVNDKLPCFHPQSPCHCLSVFFAISHAGLAHHLSLGKLLQRLLPMERWTQFHWSWEHTCAYLGLQLTSCSPFKSVFWVICMYYNLLFLGVDFSNISIIRILNFR